jgi:GNAT superfamily N-acetyltransferase
LCSKTQALVRPATLADSKALRALATQMGYAEVDADVFATRLHHILKATTSAVYVAERQATVVGWVHVYAAPLLSTPSDHPYGGYCEIGGLVVDAALRRAGIGRALMHAAQSWATAQGYARLRLYAGMQRRDEAHAFYRALGFVGKEGIGFTLAF